MFSVLKMLYPKILINVVDWSVDGKFMAVAWKQNLSILSGKFENLHSLPLPFQAAIELDYQVKGTQILILPHLNFCDHNFKLKLVYFMVLVSIFLIGTFDFTI